MDVASVEVLARKEFLLRNYLLWNDELTDALRVNLVLSENNVDSVKVRAFVFDAAISKPFPPLGNRSATILNFLFHPCTKASVEPFDLQWFRGILSGTILKLIRSEIAQQRVKNSDFDRPHQVQGPSRRGVRHDRRHIGRDTSQLCTAVVQ